jgi:dihydroorotase
MSLLIKGGRVVDPANSIDAVQDVLVKDGRIERVGPGLPAPEGVTVLDAAGKVVCPGFIDIHVHLREPGLEYKETVATGTRAAAAGGFTAVCCMANTQPVNDNRSITDYIRAKAESEGAVRVYPIGAITRGSKGEELAEYGDLKAAGCVAVSDDGKPVSSARMMRRALEYARGFDLTVIDHCEEPTLTEKAPMNEGPVATLLGLRGWPAAAETVMVERDIHLAELTGGRVHIAHLSTAGAVEAVRRGKARGIRVTAEATPHHLLLTDQLVKDTEYDTHTKMNPPLRAEQDRLAVVEGLRDGTIDCIATDHAPHTVDDKKVEFDAAAFGIVGLETAVALCLDRFVATGVLSLVQLVAALSTNPARVLSLPGGTLAVGAPADVTVLDLKRSRAIEPKHFQTKGRNTPFGGWTLTGWPSATIVGGTVVWQDVAPGKGRRPPAARRPVSRARAGTR